MLYLSWLRYSGIGFFLIGRQNDAIQHLSNGWASIPLSKLTVLRDLSLELKSGSPFSPGPTLNPFTEHVRPGFYAKVGYQVTEASKVATLSIGVRPMSFLSRRKQVSNFVVTFLGVHACLA